MELLYRLFYTFMGTTSFLFFAVKVALGHWKRRGILHEKPNIPWGNLKGVGRKKHVGEVLQSLYEKYKGKAPFIGFYAWLKPMLLVLDINAINFILNKDSENFMDRGLYHNKNIDPLSQNLMQTDGVEWKYLNKRTKALQWPEKLKNISSALLNVQRTFDNSLQEKLNQAEVICNITELVEGFNIDVISSLAFGLEGDSLRYKDTLFRKMCKNYTQHNKNVYKDYLAFCFPSIARFLQYRLYSVEATNYFQNLLHDKLHERGHLKRTHHLSNDFVQICYDSQQLFKEMDYTEITAQAFNFIPAGLEPCTTTVTLCIYELALQPDIQEKARREIHGVLSKYYNKLSEESVNEMVYLKQILNETLRKHSPYPFLLRLTTEDYELPNTTFMFKKGNYLIIPTAAIHNDTSYYEHPEKFHPDHFHSTKVQNRPLCAFLPFGLGPRSCIVQNFVKLQMLLCLATLLNRYSFAPCQETVMPMIYDNTKIRRKPEKDIKLTIKKL